MPAPLTVCTGVTPSSCSKDFSLLQQLPLPRIFNAKNQKFRITENGIHHHTCPGWITDPQRRQPYNKICEQFIHDETLNSIIVTAHNKPKE
mmetsp:Transcript_18337/g.29057  ORF Transcript_18337/g.29057 Transcript_18337/m.29057 type:complete len:91 (-) Transcript_18337:1125-1397(-)